LLIYTGTAKIWCPSANRNPRRAISRKVATSSQVDLDDIWRAGAKCNREIGDVTKLVAKDQDAGVNQLHLRHMLHICL